MDVELAAMAGAAANAASARTRPGTANWCLREGVTWEAPKL